jgi:type IV secretion system protein VirB5
LFDNETENSKAQVDSLNQLKNMSSGHYGFGDLNNGLDALQSWQSPVGVWQSYRIELK